MTLRPTALALSCLLVGAGQAPADLPVLRQNRQLWSSTIRRLHLPADAVGTVDWERRAIIVLHPQPDEEATVEHERGHVFFDTALDVVDREEWAKGWEAWGQRMPWGPARDRKVGRGREFATGVYESWGYLWEVLYAPTSPYDGREVPVEAVRLLLRIRGRER